LIKYLGSQFRIYDVIGRDDRFSGPRPIFKITDLDTADDNFGFGLPSKAKLFVVLNDPKTKKLFVRPKPDCLVGTEFTTRPQPKWQQTPRHIPFVLKAKVTVVQKMLAVRLLERIAASNAHNLIKD
jgi:hypothetical protein